jgi:hypothetical protein
MRLRARSSLGITLIRTSSPVWRAISCAVRREMKSAGCACRASCSELLASHIEGECKIFNYWLL